MGGSACFLRYLERGMKLRIFKALSICNRVQRAPGRGIETPTSRRCYLKPAATLTIAIIATAFCAHAATYSAVNDLSLSGNPNGVWSYLVSNVLMSTPYTGTGALAGFIGWSNGLPDPNGVGVLKNGTGGSVTIIGGLVLPTDHLFLNAEIGNLAVRFTAPVTAGYSVSGDFIGLVSVAPGEEAHDVAVLVNGSQVYSDTVSSYNQPDAFSLTVALNAGDTVDFVDYAGANFQFLGTGLAATITPAAPPSITPGGIVPIFSSSTTIEPGSWASIFGSNLAPGDALWNGDFPTKLADTTVTIDGKAAYLWYVSPGQINLQAPDDLKTGVVTATVTTTAGTASSTVTLAPFGPSLSLLDGKHIAGIIIRSNGSGAYGNGAYDVIGPTGTSLGYPTVAAKAGDSLELFGVGFGPTTPTVPAGAPYSGAAMATNSVQFMINGIPVLPSFAGITEAGLFQFNISLPAGLGTGDVSIQGVVGGIKSPAGAVLSLQ
jgi:uncharacterized protein (TIGR03437 family)